MRPIRLGANLVLPERFGKSDRKPSLRVFCKRRDLHPIRGVKIETRQLGIAVQARNELLPGKRVDEEVIVNEKPLLTPNPLPPGYCSIVGRKTRTQIPENHEKPGLAVPRRDFPVPDIRLEKFRHMPKRRELTLVDLCLSHVAGFDRFLILPLGHVHFSSFHHSTPLNVVICLARRALAKFRCRFFR